MQVWNRNGIPGPPICLPSGAFLVRTGGQNVELFRPTTNDNQPAADKGPSHEMSQQTGHIAPLHDAVSPAFSQGQARIFCSAARSVPCSVFGQAGRCMSHGAVGNIRSEFAFKMPGVCDLWRGAPRQPGCSARTAWDPGPGHAPDEPAGVPGRDRPLVNPCGALCRHLCPGRHLLRLWQSRHGCR